MSVFTPKQIEIFLKEINDNDLKKMFGTAFPSAVMRKPQEEVEEKLTEYWNYKIPVSLGDVIKLDKITYTVTCVYTDNSVDLLNVNGSTKINRGLYGVDVVKIGELDIIIV